MKEEVKELLKEIIGETGNLYYLQIYGDGSGFFYEAVLDNEIFDFDDEKGMLSELIKYKKECLI